MNLLQRCFCEFATLGPIGKIFPAPGTVGSAVAALLGYAILSYGTLALLFSAVITVILGTIAAEFYEQHSGEKDSSEVIIDEVAGQFAVLLCIPPFTDHLIIWCIVAFILFRFFDITKIWPVNKAELLSGGIGVMADDIVAAAWAGICLLGLYIAFGSIA